MKRLLSVAAASALLLASLGPDCPRALAQVADVGAVSTNLGGGLPNGAVGALGMAPGALGGSFGAPSFTNPNFLVLQSISARLDGINQTTPSAGVATSLSSHPQLLVQSLQRMMASPTATANPYSPEAITARTIYQALKNPDKIAALAPGLQSVHPEIGASVVSGLEKTARDFYAAGGTAAMLDQLQEHAAKLAAIAPSQIGGEESSQELEKLFIGPLTALSLPSPANGRGDSEALPLPGGERVWVRADAVDAHTPYLSPSAPSGMARLAPAVKPQPSDDVKLPISAKDLGADNLSSALAMLRAKAPKGSLTSYVIRRLADLNPDLELDARKTFVLSRSKEPELLKLLRIPEDAAGGIRTLADASRSMSVLIVAVPSEEARSAETAQLLLHEAIRAADGFDDAPARPMEQLLINGYAQKRAVDRLARERADVGVEAQTNSRYVREIGLVETLIQSIGEEPLRRLARYGDASVLREALGARWTYMTALAQAAREHPLPESALPLFYSALDQMIRLADYTGRDFESALSSLFPSATDNRAVWISKTRAELNPAPPSGLLPRLRDAYSQTIRSLAQPFRPDFDQSRRPAASLWGRALTTFLGFSVLNNTILLISAWAAGGMIPAFAAPATLALAPFLLKLALELPVFAVAEETIFRAGLNPALEKLLTWLGVSPQSSSFYAAALGSAAYAAANGAVQGWNPVNLLVKWLFGMTEAHVYRKYGLVAAIAAHYLWDVSQYATLAFPAVIPYVILISALLVVPALFRYQTKNR